MKRWRWYHRLGTYLLCYLLAFGAVFILIVVGVSNPYLMGFTEGWVSTPRGAYSFLLLPALLGWYINFIMYRRREASHHAENELEGSELTGWLERKTGLEPPPEASEEETATPH